jgi:hypothetical protein
MPMPTVHLEEIYCFHPRGGHDELRLRAVCDGAARRTIWGPEWMHRHDRIDLSRHVEGIEYFDEARISLVGDYGHNFGSMSFDDHSATGPGEFYFPGELNSNYRVRFRLDPEPAALTHGRIRLVRLTCNDAQGSHDEITLSVNGGIVLGPRHEMRTNWHVDFVDEEIDFNRACTVALSETYLQDWTRSFTLEVGEYLPGAAQHEFVANGSGVTGDARYTLDYEMVA